MEPLNSFTGPVAEIVRAFLHPTSPEQFLASSWGKQSMSAGTGRKMPPGIPRLDPEEMFTLLGRLQTRQGDVRVARFGNEVPAAQLVDKRGFVSENRLREHWRAGSSIILNSADVLVPWLGRYCRSIESWLGHPVTSRIYLSPPRSAAFPLHQDGHDVFILQLFGEKQWRLWEPTGTNGTLPTCEPDRNVVLRPPDVLYLPKGMWHEVKTGDDCSIHATIGVHATTWRMLLEWAFQDSAEGATILDETVPAGVFSTLPDLLVALTSRAERTLGSLSNNGLLNLYRERLRRWSQGCGALFQSSLTTIAVPTGAIIPLLPIASNSGATLTLRADKAIIDVPAEESQFALALASAPLHSRFVLPSPLSATASALVSQLVTAGCVVWAE